MPISQWPKDQRPRERLLLQGAAALSDAELLAIFLRTGVSGMTAVDLARRLLSEFGGVGGLLHAEQADFGRGRGLGPAKYAELQAVLELARRYLYEHLVDEPSIECSAQIKDYLALTMRASPRELFRVMLLDVRHRLIQTTELFQGTIDRAAVYPREVVKLALMHNAAAVIVAHNHPSGEAEPSPADLDLTLRLQQALALVDIALLDHFIIGRSGSVSLAERGIL